MDHLFHEPLITLSGQPFGSNHRSLHVSQLVDVRPHISLMSRSQVAVQQPVQCFIKHIAENALRSQPFDYTRPDDFGVMRRASAPPNSMTLIDELTLLNFSSRSSNFILRKQLLAVVDRLCSEQRAGDACFFRGVIQHGDETDNGQLLQVELSIG